VYRTRNSEEVAIGATGKDFWHGPIRIDETQRKIIEVGFLGGGFTLWNGGCVNKALPCRWEFRPATNPKPHGWDGNFGFDIREQGFSLLLDGFVQCEHFCALPISS